MKHYEIRIILICIICTLFSCSPQRRFLRLVKKHPYLLENISSDTIRVRDTLPSDTQIVWSKEVDTLVFREVTIERRNDTFRIIKEARPCTTLIRRNIYRPSKIVERYIKEKRRKRSIQEIAKEWIAYIIIAILLIILLKRK